MAADSLIVTMQVSNYNGFEVSCFGEKDGWIELSVSGGQPPYSYEWSNGSNEPHMVDLAAGYYKVDVIDADGQRVTKEVTLDQPLAMKLDVDVYEYANGYNISCYQCSNGNASVVVLGGAPPFTITWSDGPTGSNRYNLAAKDYKITAADANGCAGTSITIYLRGPDRSDWSMSGNPGTTPGPQYVGTPDNKDVVFKSNGQERLRLKGNGEIGLWGADTTVGPLYRDYDGTLKAGGGPVLPPYPVDKCFYLSARPYWQTKGNDFAHLCPMEPRPVLGTLSNDPLAIYANGTEQMRITTAGRVGIGTSAPAQQLDVATADESGGMNLTNIRSDANAHTELRFMKGTDQRWGLGCDFGKDGGQDFFLWDNVALSRRLAVDANGRVLIGGDAVPGPDLLYKLYVEGGIATRDVMVTAHLFPDYVFAPNYALMPLDEFERFLNTKHHLPGFPSAAEVEVDGGFEVGDMSTRLLKLAEEQSLYILQLNREVQELKARLEVLETKQ